MCEDVKFKLKTTFEALELCAQPFCSFLIDLKGFENSCYAQFLSISWSFVKSLDIIYIDAQVVY